jgi:hypothetical protein
MLTTEVPANTPPPVRLDPTARLLVLLARDVLEAELAETARALIAKITDWPEFARLAHDNFSLPFAYKHLSALGLAQTEPQLMAELRMLTMRVTMSNLKWQKAMIAFHQACIAPIGARHAYIKGPALGARYYSDAGMRLCRDIDVLVPPGDFAAVARRALDHGYRFVTSFDGPISFAEDPQDIDFMLRHGDVISMLNCDGYLFELHRHIEKMTPLFPVKGIIESSCLAKLGPCDISTMSTEWLFNYTAYHHSRHFWSKLHWVADLHAIMSHPSFDQARVLQLASEIGIAATVEATMAFADLTNRPESWEAALQSKSHGAVFLDACLRGLPGDSAYEFGKWKDMFLFDFEDTWQIDAGRKHRFWAGSALRRLEPHPTQYFENRRSRPFEFLYVIENAMALSQNLLKRMSGR